MAVLLRSAKAADAPDLGRICYDAFKAVAEAHNFPPDFPSTQVAQAILASLIDNPGVFGVVAESGGSIVGSNFVDERNVISGVGPITVNPAVQNDSIGRALMQAVLDRARSQGATGVRLVQAGYHARSLALYLKLGFEARELLVCLQGPVIAETIPGCVVRTASPADIADCDVLCHRVHGHHRGRELAEAVSGGSARVVERAGRVTGYVTAIAFFGHAVGETNDDLKALVSAGEAIAGPGLLVPAANGELMRWLLDRGLRITQTMTLMSIGLYNQPQGAWLPSVIY